MVIFSQYLRIDIPVFAYSREKGCHRAKFPLFEMFPVSEDRLNI